MNIIFILIPLSLILVGIIILAFFWSIKSGQFDDMEGPAHSVLMDDDSHQPDREKRTESDDLQTDADTTSTKPDDGHSKRP